MTLWGAYPGLDSVYTATAYALGTALAQHNFGFIYPGAGLGVMGAVANGCLIAGGYVAGVLPAALQAYNIAHLSLSELTIVDSLDARKVRMIERADAFIILPGGFGTVDEAFSVITAGQLALHAKPIALFNMANYCDALLTWIERAYHTQFIALRDMSLMQVYTTIEPLLCDLHNMLDANRDTIYRQGERKGEIKEDILRLQIKPLIHK